ncbi:undecaprenyl-phosphate glucose phosphotransferase [Mediterraneibacter glycyrrhizinilyticus]|uniref:undecaprenyl-phosphate glucose phosphotransferase n=1 Tax=Mediterraneibacter glycyrrhizinilyticus TaxID=342942 RepID=UPI001D083A2C|nr:undecaprenyl-phosphate glucose phosphotransferase [Mediterraneibacter glycyrrhizinilyticus]MCB6309306.1 undecaprenyl-phosphate glucose phosphotransferase [Lachnospiraceae bacterium 210521-DFI.1.109]MCB6427197.1 undecaprenyl-phosphate glucose phosphotransferase [Mediterraneibacter glycyrrhizinilyticus]
MIKENQKLLNWMQVLLDAAVIVVSYIFAWYIRFRSGLFALDEWYLSRQSYMKLLYVIVPVFLILYYAFRLYVPKRIMGRRLEAWRVLQANVIGLMGLILILYVLRMGDISRTMLFVFGCSNVFFEIVERNVIRLILRRIRRQGYNQKHMILVGYSRAAEQYIDRIKANPGWGYSVRGILDDNKPIGTEYKGVKVIGVIEDLNQILPANKLDEIAVTLGLGEYAKLEHIVAMCEKSGVHTKFIPDYNNIIPTKPYTEDIQGLPVINIRRVPLNNLLNRFVKRSVDLFGAVVALILFSPVMLITAIVIKVTSPGPLIFKQERIGLKNKPFYMYKFRSMVVQEDTDEKKEWTTKNDPRVTPVGRFIRRTSIDELPQLFNVLMGTMSLVGPRPERPQFVDKFKEEIPRYMIKHQVRPGLTGWAQVNGYRGDTSIRKRIEYDLYYIENWTIGFDFKIILLTFFKGFINKNAY